MTKLPINHELLRYQLWTVVLRISIAVGILALLKVVDYYHPEWFVR